jgi:[acyl-carrier-protein] S-malonyltransferase
MKKLCFEGPLAELTLTQNLQPALLTVSTAAFLCYQQVSGTQFDATAGHSLGEYSALVASGAFSFHQACKYVFARGQAMASATASGTGSMIALIAMSAHLLDPLIEWCKFATENAQKEHMTPQFVGPANYNTPTQIVVAGTLAALSILEKILQEISGIRMVPLPVAAPFHCALMAPAKQSLTPLLSHAPISPLQIPYFPNRKADLESDAKNVSAFLIDQIDQPVLWTQTMHRAFDLEFTDFVEFGCGRVLSGLAKKNALEHPQKPMITTQCITQSKDLVALGSTTGPDKHSFLEKVL